MPRDRGPLRRNPDERLLGGIAGGLSARVGVDVTLVRVALVVFGLASGFGVAAYALGWLFIPMRGEDKTIAARAASDRRGLALASLVLAALLVLVLLAAAVGGSWASSPGWAVAVGAAAIVLLWRNAPEHERAHLHRISRPLEQLRSDGDHASWVFVVRVGIGFGLLAGGLIALLLGHPSTALLRPLGGVVLVIAGIVVVLGPWWLSVARNLVAERQARARAEERADMAARVHDSVLQTLALIQRRADQPQQVVQLARAQERELRSWLFEGKAPGSSGADDHTMAEGIRRIEREVEAAHGVAVDAVTVGDCELDDDLRALLAAGREATVNAAKWSEANVISLFAEVEPRSVALYVKDRGRGFDPAAVAPDRKGIEESVRGRVARSGGTSTIESVRGDGTEVTLVMPRRAARRQRSSSP